MGQATKRTRENRTITVRYVYSSYRLDLVCPESINGAPSSTLCGANNECAAGCLDHILCDDM